jgi:hypothetical protein
MQHPPCKFADLGHSLPGPWAAQVLLLDQGSVGFVARLLGPRVGPLPDLLGPRVGLRALSRCSLV